MREEHYGKKISHWSETRGRVKNVTKVGGYRFQHVLVRDHGLEVRSVWSECQLPIPIKCATIADAGL